jgi:hypothetical protein
MSIDMDRTCRVYFFIYDPDSGGEAVRQDTRCFIHSNLFITGSFWFRQDSFKPIQTGSYWFRQDSFKPIQTGSYCMVQAGLIQTYSDWFILVQAGLIQNIFRLVQTDSGRMQDVLFIQTYSDWFKLVRQDARCFTHSNLFRLVQTR